MQSKLPDSQSSYFWSMRNLALEKNAIDMSLGVTEFTCPVKLAELPAG